MFTCIAVPDSWFVECHLSQFGFVVATIDIHCKDFVHLLVQKDWVVKSQETHLQNLCLVSGIPGSIIELSQVRHLLKQFSLSQVWVKRWIDSIKASNTMVIGYFHITWYLAAMLGDILMTVLDPRIKLTNTKGGYNR